MGVGVRDCLKPEVSGIGGLTSISSITPETSEAYKSITMLSTYVKFVIKFTCVAIVNVNPKYLMAFVPHANSFKC
jgi:hypothetical protein